MGTFFAAAVCLANDTVTVVTPALFEDGFEKHGLSKMSNNPN